MPKLKLNDNQLVCIKEDEKRSLCYLEWEPPSNINNFDLDRYDVTTTDQSASVVVASVNTSTVLAINPTSKLVNVSIVAITECGQRGNEISLQVMVQNLPCSSSSTTPVAKQWSYKFLVCAMSVIVAFYCCV